MIPRTQYGRSMAIDRSRYVISDPFHEWQSELFAEAERRGMTWGALIQTLDDQEIPECARSFVAAYRRPPKPTQRPRPGKDPRP